MTIIHSTERRASNASGRVPQRRHLSRHCAIVIAYAAAMFTGLNAAGHAERGEAAGFLSGFAHPISGLDHVAAMVAVGMWGAQLGAPALWVLPVAFPLVMAFGGFLGFVGVALPATEFAIAASAILLGASVAFEWRPPLAVAAAFVGVFAIFHGYAHGTELPAGASAALYSMGFVVATGCLHACGIGIGTLQRSAIGAHALRGAGA